MLYNYAIIQDNKKDPNSITDPYELAYKALCAFNDDYNFHGDSVEQKISNILKSHSEEDSKEEAWCIYNKDFSDLYLLKTESNFFRDHNVESDFFNFISTNKEQWKLFFKKMITERKIYDVTTSFTDYDYERLSEIIQKVTQNSCTNTEIEEAIEIFNNIIDENDDNIHSSEIAFKVTTIEGDISFSLSTFFTIKTNHFFCNDYSRIVDSHLIESKIQEVVNDILNFFKFTDKKVNFINLDLTETILVDHPLKNSNKFLNILMEQVNIDNFSYPEIEEINIILNYLKEHTKSFEEKRIYPWDANKYK